MKVCLGNEVEFGNLVHLPLIWIQTSLSYFEILRYCSPYFQEYDALLKKKKTAVGLNAAGSAIVSPVYCKT